MSSHSQSGPGMPPTSWKSLASSHLASFKQYVGQKDYKGTYDVLSSRVRGRRVERSGQTWDQWARQTLRMPYALSVDAYQGDPGVTKVHMFPGWAVRRYRDPSKMTEQGAEFDVDVYVSGFASRHRPPEAATRSQRAFYRLAKSYAALPRLPIHLNSQGDGLERQPTGSQRLDSPSDPLPSKLSLEPAQTIELEEFETLEAQFREISASPSALSAYNSDDSDDSSAFTSNQYFSSRSPHKDESLREHADVYGHSCHPEPAQRTSDSTTPISRISGASSAQAVSFPDPMTDYEVQQCHANLDARLQPFWSSAISNRVIRLSIFCPPSGDSLLESQDMTELQDSHLEPLAHMDVTTSPQGVFHTTFKVPWKRLATYPPTLHIAFGTSDVEYPVVVQAEIKPLLPSMSSSSSSLLSPYSPNHRNNASYPRHEWSTASSFSLPPSPQLAPDDLSVPSIKSHITLSLSMSHVPVRLISDIDDTIKHTGVLKGAKHVFQNVFVRNLEELVIHSMVGWYQALWHRGVRFHYVSNSPFELLPVLTKFIQLSSLPEGSIRLKSYAARSLFPALLSPPAARKRPGVVEVLDAFPESHFILVGDTGEQDMELYAELARERPGQIVAVLLRDVTTGTTSQEPGTAVSDTGYLHGASKVQFESLLIDKQPSPIEAMPSLDTLRSAAWATSRLSNVAGCLPPSPRDLPSDPDPYFYTPPSANAPATSQSRYPNLFPRRKSSGGVTPEERRRCELQIRIERARSEIPSHTAFRVFREPNECVEVQQILDQLTNSNR